MRKLITRMRLLVFIFSSLLICYMFLIFHLPPKDKVKRTMKKLRKRHVKSTISESIFIQSLSLPQNIKIKDLYERGYYYDNSKLCSEEGRNIVVFIAVFSSASNSANRTTIRNTWGYFSRRSDIALGFLIGSFENKTLAEVLKREQFLYGDIIWTRFVDSYDNMTYKTLSMLEWVNRFCKKTKFVLKTDDDMFINVSKLLELIETLPTNSYAIYGKVIDKMRRFKNVTSKHYLPPAQYNLDILPKYVSGPAYLIPGHLTQILLEKSLNHTAFRLEDVFISGIIANSLKIKLVHIPAFYNFHLNINPCNVQHRISLHNMNHDEQFEIWKNLHKRSIKCGIKKLGIL